MIVEKLVQEAEWRGEKLTKTSAKKMVNDMFGGLITLGAGSERITLVKKIMDKGWIKNAQKVY